MPENAQAEVTTTIQDESTQTVDNNSAIPFDFEGREAPVIDGNAAQTTQLVDDTTTQQQTQQNDDEVVDANEYLKTHLGFENWDVAKAEIAKLKESAQTKEEKKFANEQSKILYEYLQDGKEEEAFKILSEKKKLERVLSADVNDLNAEEIIKLSMQKKYADLTEEEVNHKFNKQYQFPKEPIQGVDELDSEFEQRKSDWDNQVKEVKRDMVIDAKLAKPDLDKLKADLVLPSISKDNQQVKQPTQEELDDYKKLVDNYHVSVQEAIKDFGSFNITAKDEDVEMPISYSLSDEEKTSVTNQLKEFEERGFDANALFAQRWLNQDGTMNVKQISKDLFLLNNEGKISQKFVNDAVAKAKANYIKTKSNININQSGAGQTFQPQGDKSEREKLADTFWNA